MQKQILAWQTVSIYNGPELNSGRSIVDRAPRPIAHVTRQRRLYDLLSEGDSVWLVGKYSKLSNASVSMIGRIVISDKILDDGILRFRGSPESHWLPWNDATKLINTLRLNSRRGVVSFSQEVGFAQQLQTSREVAAISYDALQEYSTELRSRPSVFLSYNWSRSTDLMPHLLPALAAIGLSVWVDRWSGPRRLGDGRKTQSTERVQELLKDAICVSDLFISLICNDYRTGYWTSFESLTAHQNKKFGIDLSTDNLRQHIRQGDLHSYLVGQLPPKFRPRL